MFPSPVIKFKRALIYAGFSDVELSKETSEISRIEIFPVSKNLFNFSEAKLHVSFILSSNEVALLVVEAIFFENDRFNENSMLFFGNNVIKEIIGSSK